MTPTPHPSVPPLRAGRLAALVDPTEDLVLEDAERQGAAPEQHSMERRGVEVRAQTRLGAPAQCEQRSAIP